ncbi:MAG: phage tail protein, partial [Sphingomonadales bacterium]
MSAITLVITAAGRAALVNAAAAGTNAVTITQAGFTSLAFAAAAGMTALPGEFKRVTTLSGAVVDPDTIHLVLRDDSAAAYALRGLALYLSDGTLFALYGQPDPILEKSASATALLAIDVRFADITAASLAFGDANFLNPPATTSTAGVVELATIAEAAGGGDTIRAITPATLKAVIDARFGVGAATAFARQLLAAPDAPAARGALELRGAALKEEGHGNGLDADTVDGYHVSRGGAGGAWPCLPVVNSDGVMEVGRFIDFHNASNDPADFRGRLELQGALLFWSGAALWHAGND